jgi:acetyltransferase-like isoleucine patch superfamily enzyme
MNLLSKSRRYLKAPTPARIRRVAERVPVEIGYDKGPRLMSWLRKRWVLLRHPHADIRFGRGCYLGPGFSLHIPGPATFEVGDNVEFRRNFRAELIPGARISIGSGCYFTYDVILACSTTIDIGERCGFAQATFVADGSHRYRDLSKAFLDQGYEFRPIVIEDDVQVHSKCTIVAGIGKRTVLGANAMVSKPLPAYTLAAGVPARVLDYFGPPGEEPEGWAGASKAGAANA